MHHAADRRARFELGEQCVHRVAAVEDEREADEDADEVELRAGHAAEAHEDAALEAVVAPGGLAGVVGISNALTVVPSASQHDVRSRIEEALKRDAELQANAIRVSVADGTVTLEGRVNSLTERRIAERAAWAGAGVRRVDDRLTIG